MASTIKIKRSSVAAKVPTTADINSGELALNITDRKLYCSNGTTVFEIGTHKLSVANAASIYQTISVERAALANTNLAITNVKTGLTSTNTALRILISDRLQVANASATYQTKATERAALANTNSFIKSQLANTNLAITNVKTGLTSTNTAIRTLVSDRLQVANAVAIYATKSNPTTSGLLAHTGRATISTNLNVSGNTVIGKLVANGSLGTSGYALKSNGSTVYWDAVGAAASSGATWAALTSTNTAIRTLVSDRLQVANAAAIYQTIAIERAALANTNLAITNVKTGLTSTNTALRTLISDRLQVANAASIYQTISVERAALANTNSFIATKVNTTTFNSALANTNLAITNVKTGLTTTNTALRTLISDRLQVANAAAIYQTISVERAALANTNLAITNVKTGLTSTNTALRTLISDRLQVANASTLYATKTNPTTSGLLAHTGRATISTNLGVTGNTNIGGSLVVTGDLTINGTTTTLNSTTVSVDDINIILGDTASPTNASADGGGITLKGATDKTFNWVNATGAWTSSENLNLANGKSLYLNGTDFGAIYAANSYVKSTLANTNLAITNVKTGLTTTNTALRTLVSDRLQVANAASIYQTIATERAALANTNTFIATKLNTSTFNSALSNTNLAITNVKTGLTATNTAIRTLVSDRLQVANAATLYATKISPTTSELLAHTGRATISTNLAVSGNTSTNKATVTSALTVSGNTTLGADSKTITTTGLLAHTGRATISTNLNVSGNTVIGKLVANGSLGTSGYALKTNGSTVYWDADASSITLSNDTATATTLYPTFASATTGTTSSIYTSNAKLLYKPSTGELSATAPIASNGLVLNATTVATSYTIASGYNASSVGPITISGGVAVTITSGQRWLVL